MSVNFTTMRGRLVQGDCYTAQQRRTNTGQLMVHPAGHPNAGQPVMQFFVALAVAKNDSAWPAFRESLMVEQRAAWPQFHNPQGQCTNPTFADKITDGDGTDSKGVSYATREGWPGHWILKFASSFAPKVFEWSAELGAWKETEPGKVKLGDYVRISGTCQSNQSAQSPGMYMNLNMVAFEEEGPRIVLGPTAEQAFGAPGSGATATGGGAAAAAPPPATGAPVMLPAANGLSYESYKASGWSDQQLIDAGMMQAPAAASPPPPPAQAAAPPPPAAAGAPPPPAYSGFMMLPAANGISYDAYKAQGWTDQQLIDAGMMQAPAAA